MSERTIAAVATPPGEGSVGVIRISGEKAIEIADSVFFAVSDKPLSALKGYTAAYGEIRDGETVLDDAVALVFKAPKSYTGEDVVEISVHGGALILRDTLRLLYKKGAFPAEPGEFTKRAFLNGKTDLARAESIMGLISAKNESQLRLSRAAHLGRISEKIDGIISRLTSADASIAVYSDYPDEEIEGLDRESFLSLLKACADETEQMLSTYNAGRVLREGIETVIVGKPNVGKSTLMNMLSGKEKSIVTHIEGTTRDIVENSVRLGTLVLHLSDTAGLRESDDVVEAIGIKKALERIDTSSLVLAVFDSSRELDGDDKMLIDACKGKKAVAVINKTDLSPAIDTEEIENNFESSVYISAKNNTGLKELENAVKNILGVEEFDSSAPLIANQRQKLCIQKAYENISEALSAAELGLTYDAVNVMIDSAVDELLALTGKKATEEVVNNIFSRFCVGK